MSVVDRSFDHPLKIEEKAAMPLAGGIMQYGYQCGMVWGAVLAAGAHAYRVFGAGPEAEIRAIVAAQQLVESFRTRNKYVDCLEITEINKDSSAMQMVMRFLVKGGVVSCFRMAASYAPAAIGKIDAVLSEKAMETPLPPVSCAAMVAKKMGASDLHTVMAAGLAGGIGLSGGACGALGAAIWISGIRALKEGATIKYKSPEAAEAIEKFIKVSDYEFECAKIVGRKFESVADHARYLRDEGCAKIIEVLATT